MGGYMFGNLLVPMVVMLAVMSILALAYNVVNRKFFAMTGLPVPVYIIAHRVIVAMKESVLKYPKTSSLLSSFVFTTFAVALMHYGLWAVFTVLALVGVIGAYYVRKQWEGFVEDRQYLLNCDSHLRETMAYVKSVVPHLDERSGEHLTNTLDVLSYRTWEYALVVSKYWNFNPDAVNARHALNQPKNVMEQAKDDVFRYRENEAVYRARYKALNGVSIGDYSIVADDDESYLSLLFEGYHATRATLEEIRDKARSDMQSAVYHCEELLDKTKECMVTFEAYIASGHYSRDAIEQGLSEKRKGKRKEL